MVRFAIGGFAAALLAVAGGASAAPVPKGAGTTDPTPDLQAFFDTAGKAVADGKWPAAADEARLRDTAQAVFDRTLKAAEQKGRALPVDFAKLAKADVAKQFKGASLAGGFVIAGDVQITSASNCAIFATGDVKITSATNCVIVGRNVRCTVADGCAIVADDYLRLTGARAQNGQDGSVLVAGQWIHATGATDTVCHVLRPGTLPPPDVAKLAGTGPYPAIRMTSAVGVTFLNGTDQWKATSNKNCTTVEPKAPIAK